MAEHGTAAAGTRLTLSRKALLFVAVPLVFQVVLVAAFQTMKRRSEEDGRAQFHSAEVLGSANRLLRLVVEVEAALRGYALTGDRMLARPYQRALQEMPSALASLQALAQDQPIERQAVADLAVRARQQLDTATTEYRLMESGATEEAVAAISGGAGRQATEELRAEIERFMTLEERLGAGRREAAEASVARLDRFVLIGSALSILAALAPLLLIAGVARRVGALADNVRRFGAGQPLRPARAGTDEIADLDRALHRMSEDLAHASRQLAAVLDSMAEGLYRLDGQGRLAYLNPAAERMLGYALDEIRGKEMHGLIHFRAPDGGDRPASTCPLEAVIRDGVVCRAAEDHFVRKDGTFLTVAYTSAPIVEDGETTGAVLTFQDITERRRAEKSLRESEGSLRAVIDNMLGGLIVIEPSGFIEIVNAAAERIFGYSRNELVGQHLMMLVPPTAGTNPRAFLKAAAGKALGRITEWEGLRKNGEIFPFELSMFEFQTETGRHLAGSVRDISERREVERLKKEFVSTVSHELRTPLTSLRGSLGLLAGGVLGELSDEAREVVQIGERNCTRLIGLVNDMLDLERLESGRLELRVEDAALASILKRSAESVLGMAEAHGVALEIAATEARVRGDADRLVQVVINLLSNAVKFSPPGSAVTVTGRRQGAWVEVRVEDRGRGIPAAMRDAIFERFKQVEASDDRQKGGTGLGLAICKAIVEQHGGQIGVESEEGRGSAFWFRVPAAGAPSAELLSPRDVPVVVLESGVGARAALTALLGERGYPVEAASSLAEASELLGRRDASLLLVGTPPPGVSLRECRETLRSASGLEPLPLSVLGELSHADLPESLILYFARRASDPLVKSLQEAEPSPADAPGDVLLVDDDELLLGVLARQLLQHGIPVRVGTTVREALKQALMKPPRLLVLDLGLPDGEGRDVVMQMRTDPRLADLPLLVYTGRDLNREQEDALRLGPTRFLTKSRATDDQFLALVNELMTAPAGAGRPT